MSSSGGTSCSGGPSPASVSEPAGANRVTSCPRSVSPSANSATTHSMPPYPLGGTGYQGGAITAIRMELLGSVKRVTKPGYPPGGKPSNWVRQGGSASVAAAPPLGPINAGVQASRGSRHHRRRSGPSPIHLKVVQEEPMAAWVSPLVQLLGHQDAAQVTRARAAWPLRLGWKKSRVLTWLALSW